jgi:hypothetical protein
VNKLKSSDNNGLCDGRILSVDLVDCDRQPTRQISTRTGRCEGGEARVGRAEYRFQCRTNLARQHGENYVAAAALVFEVLGLQLMLRQ